MDIYSFLQVLAGLAFFLYGMNVMSSSLERMAGGSLETTMKKVTSNPILSFLLGALITVAIQSSSGAVVMLVGLVNSGIINFENTLPILLGTNVGTTVTGWILTLTSVSTDGFSLLSVMNPKFFSPILAFIGIVLRMVSKKEKHKDLGTIFVGFAILMYGMTFMSDAMKSVANEPWFASMLLMFTNPFVAFLVATVFTGIIQSSAATIGIIEAFAMSGNITYQVAIPLILGANVGTCITGLISAIGVSKNAKRVSVLQLVFNSFTAVAVLIVMIIVSGGLSILHQSASAAHVALLHTAFNVLVTIICIFGGSLLIKVTKMIVRDDAADLPKILIDDRLLSQPSIAVNECMNNTIIMGKKAQECLNTALNLLFEYDENKYQDVVNLEEETDWYEDELDTYLVKLSKIALSEEASENVSKMLHVITDFERIGDHAINLATLAKKYHEGTDHFSQEAVNEVNTLIGAIKEIMGFSIDAFNNNDLASAAQVEPLEETIDVLTDNMMDAHVDRLVKGECTIDMGIILSDMINNCERVSDHCSNIAVCVIEVSDDEFYTHQYLNDVKHDSDGFKALYKYYMDKYSIRK